MISYFKLRFATQSHGRRGVWSDQSA